MGIKKFFDHQSLNLPIPEVSGNVEAAGFTIPIPDIPSLNRDISVLERTLKLGASVTAAAEALAQGNGAKLYEDGGNPADAEIEFKPRGDHLLARLELGVDAGLSGSGTIPTGIELLSASFDGKLTTDFFYRHWTLIQVGQSKLKALTQMAAIAMPNLLDPARLNNEVHSLSFKLKLDLGLKASFGYEKKFSLERDVLGSLFDRVALRADVLATLEASLGFSLFEQLNFSLGDLGAERDRVRLRLYREHSRELSFGVVFNLMVKYDLGSSLIAILDQALELEPVKEIREYIDDFAKAAKTVADGDWDQIKQKLSAKARAFVLEALPLDELTNNQEVKRVAALASKIIGQYDGLEERLRNLWDRILTEANLKPDSEIRQALARIQDLDVSGIDMALDGILGQDFAKALDLLETLTGKSLEDLVTDRVASLSIVKKAQDLAKKVLEFLDDAPRELLSAWQKNARKWGVEQVVDWIRDHASTPKKIRDAAEGEIKKAIEKLLGKAVDKIRTMDDVHTLQNWASRVAEKLEDIQDFDLTLKKNLQKLIGEQGVNLSLQIDRVTRKTRLLDLDFDPRDKGMRRAWKNLATLDVKGFLADLPEADDDQEEQPADLPFTIRECLFTHTKTSSSALALLLSGLFNRDKKVTRRRLTESSIRLTQQGTVVRRQASYSGGLFLETAHKSDMSWMGGISLVCDAQGAGANLDAAYDKPAGFSFKLSTTRSDPSTNDEDLAGIHMLLLDLGFQVGTPLNSSVPANAETKLAVDWVLGGRAVLQFFKGIGSWDEESIPFDRSIYVAAGRRWLATKLVSKQIGGLEANMLLPWLLSEPSYRQFWKQSYQAYRERGDYVVGFPGKRVAIRVAGSAYPTTRLLLKSKLGPRALSGVGGLVNNAGAPRHQELWDLMAGFARASKVASPEAWDSPLFMLWLIVKRLALTVDGFDITNHASGLATLRYCQNGGDWQPPLSYRAG